MKILFERIILVAVVAYLCLSIASCKKNLDGLSIPSSEYYVRFKQDGAKKELRLPDSAYFYHAMSGVASFGAGGVDANLNVISIVINDYTGAEIKTGKTYRNTKSGDFNTVQAIITWGNSFGASYNTPMLTEPGSESAEIVLTEITDKYVKGSFKGKLLENNGNSTTVKYVLTEGAFYLPRSNSPLKFNATTPGDGFMQGAIDGKNIVIKEAENGDPLNQVWAKYWYDDSYGPRVYNLSVLGQSNPALPGFKSIMLIFTSEKPLATGQYNYYDAPSTPSFNLFTGAVQLRNAQNSLVTYVGAVTDSNSYAMLKLTKFNRKTGDYIEGEFIANNAFSLDPMGIRYSLTNGKFRAKLL